MGGHSLTYTGANALALAVEFRPTAPLVDLDLPDRSAYAPVGPVALDEVFT